jgi:hypothetical protein
MIVVVPEGGLCNRLRVVASSWMLAQALGQGLCVHWLRTADFNSRFDALFEVEGLPFEVQERRAMGLPGKIISRGREWAARAAGWAFLGPSQTEPGRFDMVSAVSALARRQIFIRTNSRLAQQPGMFDIFRPGGVAAHRISQLQPRSRASIGVHVRRTDNLRAQAESTLERFVDLMRAELATAPSAEFFVATDEPVVLEAFMRQFGERVWEYPKRAYSRNDPVAIIDAVVDLYSLAHTRRLIGSYWSSFTDTAADIRGIPCVIAKAQP